MELVDLIAAATQHSQSLDGWEKCWLTENFKVAFGVGNVRSQMPDNNELQLNFSNKVDVL